MNDIIKSHITRSTDCSHTASLHWQICCMSL